MSDALNIAARDPKYQLNSILKYYRMIFNQFSSMQFHLTLYLIRTPFEKFANREDPDQAVLVRAA